MSAEREFAPFPEEQKHLLWAKEVCDKHHNLTLLAGVLTPEIETCALRGDAVDGKPLHADALLSMAVRDSLWRPEWTTPTWVSWAWDLIDQDENSITVPSGKHAPRHLKTTLGDAWIVKPAEAASDLLDRMYDRIRRITSDEIMNGRCYL